jgi:hypothetical protein
MAHFQEFKNEEEAARFYYGETPKDPKQIVDYSYLRSIGSESAQNARKKYIEEFIRTETKKEHKIMREFKQDYHWHELADFKIDISRIKKKSDIVILGRGAHVDSKVCPAVWQFKPVGEYFTATLITTASPRHVVAFHQGPHNAIFKVLNPSGDLGDRDGFKSKEGEPDVLIDFESAKRFAKYKRLPEPDDTIDATNPPPDFMDLKRAEALASLSDLYILQLFLGVGWPDDKEAPDVVSITSAKLAAEKPEFLKDNETMEPEDIIFKYKDDIIRIFRSWRYNVFYNFPEKLDEEEEKKAKEIADAQKKGAFAIKDKAVIDREDPKFFQKKNAHLKCTRKLCGKRHAKNGGFFNKPYQVFMKNKKSDPHDKSSSFQAFKPVGREQQKELFGGGSSITSVEIFVPCIWIGFKPMGKDYKWLSVAHHELIRSFVFCAPPDNSAKDEYNSSMADTNEDEAAMYDPVEPSEAPSSSSSSSWAGTADASQMQNEEEEKKMELEKDPNLVTPARKKRKAAPAVAGEHRRSKRQKKEEEESESDASYKPSDDSDLDNK